MILILRIGMTIAILIIAMETIIFLGFYLYELIEKYFIYKK